MAADNSVIIYSPTGAPERHTRANARDYVYARGYTWHPFLPAGLTGFASFAQVSAPDGPSPSQQVLDRIAGKGEGASAAAGAAAAAAAQQQQMAMALAAQQAAIAAAAQQAAQQAALAQAAQTAAIQAAALPVVADADIPDFSNPPPVDTSDLDNDPEEAAADAGTEAAAPVAPRRGRRPRS